MKKIQPWATPPVLRLVALSPNHRKRSAWHDHPFYELGIVLGGRCDWLMGTRRLGLTVGEALLLKPGVRHCEEVETGEVARVAWLGFELESEPEWCHRTITLKDDLAEIAGCFDAVSREHHVSGLRSRQRINLALQTLVLLVDRRAEASSSRRPQKSSTTLNPRQMHTVESAAHYFRMNLLEPLSIAQVASYHSLCPAHFSSLFRRHHAVTPREFVRQARLRRAVDQLVEGDATVKEIAAECGFVDAAHFCKSFRKEHRTTPSLFRRRMKKAPFAVIRA